MTKAVVTAGWDDAPHLSDAEKARLVEAIPPAFRDARTRGIPTIGEGAIYPLPTDAYVIDDIPVAKHWPRGYGMDVGWKATAALWGAYDREADIVNVFREYKRGQAEPSVHAAAITLTSKNMAGAIDPASRGRSQKDGSRLLDDYRELGLDLISAKNAVEAGLLEVYLRLSTGRLRVFRSCTKLIGELRLYRRDDKGHVVKENDHLADCLRYLIATLEDVVAAWKPEGGVVEPRRRQGEGSWMGR